MLYVTSQWIIPYTLFHPYSNSQFPYHNPKLESAASALLLFIFWFQASRMASYLVNDPKYSFLKELGMLQDKPREYFNLPKENLNYA